MGVNTDNNSDKEITTVQQAVDAYLSYYKANGGLEGTDELYKWKIIESQTGKPRLDSDDVLLNDLTSLNISNLLYGPQRTAFVNLAKFKPKEYREIFKALFDESTDLQSRIDSFIKSCDTLWETIKHNFDKKTSALCDERSTSFFLTLRNPQTYTLYKLDVYKVLCKLTNSQPAKGKNKLSHFYNLLKTEFAPIVSANAELVQLVKDELGAKSHQFNLLLLAQTILWYVLRYPNEAIDFEMEKATENMTKTMKDQTFAVLKQKKQIILQGAPGTGKTYKTAELAVAVCDGEGDVVGKTHKEIMERYETLQKEHRIEFCTFHQSMDYEDFVEGLKPQVVSTEKNETSGIEYVVEDGIFKQMCDNARQIKIEHTHSEIDFKKAKVFKMSLGEVAREEGTIIFDYCIENNVVCLGWGGDIDFSDCQKREDFKHKCKDWGAFAMEIFKTWMKVGDIIIVSNGNKKFRAIARITGEYEYRPDTEIGVCQFRKVEWLYNGKDIPVNKIFYKQFSQQSIYGMYNTINGKPRNTVDTSVLNSIITGDVVKRKQDYVLIIDEINRGNVSKIFGELITLLEKDKRTGENNEHPITVTLPYSKKAFSVPDNLYIIGTMNTTDRSTGTIDYAIRRRFAFVTLEANKELIKDDKAKALFDNVRKFIEQRKADSEFDMEDLMVGHSYFMVSDDEDIKLKMEFEVVPLIKEYIKDGILTKQDDDAQYFESWEKGQPYFKATE